MDSAATPVRYDDLDALRGWAVLGVLSVHAADRTGWQRFVGGDVASAGKYGVQLFFMVSAFTIFLTLDRARWKGWWTCQEFFIRRFFRILPMFWLALALYAFVPGRESTHARFTPLAYALTASLQHGWLPGLCNALVPGSWSIAVEAAFYLVAPLCFRLVRTWQAALWLLLGTLAASAGANASLAALYRGGDVFAGVPPAWMRLYIYYWFPTQLPVFACGILAYQLVRHLELRPWSRPTGALLLATSALWIATSVGVGAHGWISEHVFFALGFLLLILGLKTWPVRVLVNPATQFLGKISYSVYLLHFAVMAVASQSLNTFLEPEWQEGRLAYALLLAATLLGSVPLAWLAYRYVERPFIDLGARLIRRRRLVAEARATSRTLENVAQDGLGAECSHAPAAR